MHFVFGSITTAFAKAQYAQDAPLGAQEKRARVKWKKGMWRLLGRGEQQRGSNGKREKRALQSSNRNGTRIHLLFSDAEENFATKSETRKERLFLVARVLIFSVYRACLSSALRQFRRICRKG